mmetsp:Transcript_69333/g.115641  ORF Transcript_69333/g.115641 Transcript_69333/m.115641 type:complete len:304 (+) Transcript_69333:2918-3829(+)
MEATIQDVPTFGVGVGMGRLQLDDSSEIGHGRNCCCVVIELGGMQTPALVERLRGRRVQLDDSVVVRHCPLPVPQTVVHGGPLVVRIAGGRGQHDGLHGLLKGIHVVAHPGVQLAFTEVRRGTLRVTLLRSLKVLQRPFCVIELGRPQVPPLDERFRERRVAFEGCGVARHRVGVLLLHLLELTQRHVVSGGLRILAALGLLGLVQKVPQNDVDAVVFAAAFLTVVHSGLKGRQQRNFCTLATLPRERSGMGFLRVLHLQPPLVSVHDLHIFTDPIRRDGDGDGVWRQVDHIGHSRKVWVPLL